MRIVFGAGFVGSRVAELVAKRGDEVLATVRSSSRAEVVAQLSGVRVTRDPVCEVAARFADETTHAIVCFPPDGATDEALAPLLAGVRAISYVSTTGVYGYTEGIIDDETPVPEERSPAQERVLRAEAAYRAVGGTVLRAPGIYGPDRGLHVRVRTGKHELPGDGRGVGSRIHVDDLAALLIASERVHGETFVVGDLEPAPQREVVEWICHEYGCPFPPSVAAERVPETLRRNRRVDARRALSVLNVTLTYPSFREGMKPRCQI